jgi:hypothetical protein
MFQALILMFEGATAWDRIAQQAPGPARVFCLRLLPMMLLTTALEGLGLAHWGKWQPDVLHYRIFSSKQIIGYEAGQFLLNLVIILLSAWLVQVMGRTFHGRDTYTYNRSLTVVVCSLSPMFLLRLLDPLPGMNPYISWALGIVLSVWVLYDGLPRLLLPDPTHAFGLYLSCAFVLVLATGAVRIFTGLYLQGNASFSQSALGRGMIELIGH